MSFEEYPPIPDKILKPDGSVVSIINAEEIAPADAVRARIYQEMPLLAAKYLLPGGTVVNGVPITTIISGSPAEGNIIVVTADGGLQYASGGAVEVPGNDTEIMFNNAGSLGADTGFEYDKTTKKFKVHGFSVENGQIELSSIPDLQAMGFVKTFTAGETLAFRDACYLNVSGQACKSNAASLLSLPAKCVCLQELSLGEAGLFLEYGWIRDDSLSLTPGGPIYVSAVSGQWTQTLPSSSDYTAPYNIQIIGVAETSSIVKIAPESSLGRIEVSLVACGTTDTSIYPAYLSRTPLVFTGDKSSTHTITLEDWVEADIGKAFTVAKVGTGLGVMRLVLPYLCVAYTDAGQSTAGGYVELPGSKVGSMTWIITGDYSIQLVAYNGTMTLSS